MAARQGQIAAQGQSQLANRGANDMMSRLFPTAAEQERQRQQVASMQRSDNQRQAAALQAEMERLQQARQGRAWYDVPLSDRTRLTAINRDLARLNRQR
jgi:hypothetical protein